ncbi:hypothetical protein JQC92_16645 [Shewanella sp. 202IG2-18]|uniref:hypothetical protein n=1 Tax=Parashewanella hymeniacidonis TaxID=2807618 RepID=UPI00195FA6D3|nr:hypothetical protein [Parashewanella hymeniacidonis]MBM7073640.1 hypothetical protein [Parashewanella hymeniacidonis]
MNPLIGKSISTESGSFETIPTSVILDISPLQEQFSYLDSETIKLAWECLSIHFDDKNIERAKQVYLSLCSYQVTDRDKINLFLELKNLALPGSKPQFLVETTEVRKGFKKTFVAPQCSLAFTVLDLPLEKLDERLNEHIKSSDEAETEIAFMRDLTRDTANNSDAFTFNGKSIDASVLTELQESCGENLAAVLTLAKQGIGADVYMMLLDLFAGSILAETLATQTERSYEISKQEDSIQIMFKIYKDLTFNEEDQFEANVSACESLDYPKSVETFVAVSIFKGQVKSTLARVTLGESVKFKSAPFATRPI